MLTEEDILTPHPSDEAFFARAREMFDRAKRMMLAMGLSEEHIDSMQNEVA